MYKIIKDDNGYLSVVNETNKRVILSGFNSSNTDLQIANIFGSPKLIVVSQVIDTNNYLSFYTLRGKAVASVVVDMKTASSLKDDINQIFTTEYGTEYFALYSQNQLVEVHKAVNGNLNYLSGIDNSKNLLIFDYNGNEIVRERFNSTVEARNYFNDMFELDMGKTA